MQMNNFGNNLTSRCYQAIKPSSHARNPAFRVSKRMQKIEMAAIRGDKEDGRVNRSDFLLLTKA